MEITHNFIDFTELDEIQLVLWTEGTWEHEKNLCPLNGSNPFRDTTDLNGTPMYQTLNVQMKQNSAYLVLPSSDFSTLRIAREIASF